MPRTRRRHHSRDRSSGGMRDKRRRVDSEENSPIASEVASPWVWFYIFCQFSKLILLIELFYYFHFIRLLLIALYWYHRPIDAILIGHVIKIRVQMPNVVVMNQMPAQESQRNQRKFYFLQSIEEEWLKAIKFWSKGFF